MTLQRRLQLVNCHTDPEVEQHWMESAIKVAFATSDMQNVDQHFGAAQSFVIYALTMEASRFVEVVEFGKLTMDGNEDKLESKIAVLQGCIAVYSGAIGASAIRQLQANGIQPVKVSAGSKISELLQNLQDELKQGPCSWLARAIEQQTSSNPARFDEMDEQGWQE